MSDYQPIACALHDLFEIAILRGQRLRARWETAGGEVCEGMLVPVDLRVRDRAEWLLAEDAGGVSVELRLDRIISARPTNGYG